jgi:hypothetical protein
MMMDILSASPTTALRTAAQAALWYLETLGWPVTPVCDPGCRCHGLGDRPEATTPALVQSAWERCPDAPVYAVLGRAVPGAARLGVLDVPALVGAAALERLGRRPLAAGPVTDGAGRIRFLVDMGPADACCPVLERWRTAGIDLSQAADGARTVLPTPGRTGPESVVWAVPPDPARLGLPPIEQVAHLVDRAVRDAYPALWTVVTR